MTLLGTDVEAALTAAHAHSAHNYDPLPVVLESGRGAWVRDVNGTDYLDLLAGYSALNFGHAHPVLVEVAQQQIARLTLTSRAFQHDRFATFCADLARLCGKDAVLPMNTGAEAVETALEVARKWGYERKGVRPGAAEVITCAGNFHGRTITIVGFSTDPDANTNFGPYPAGFVTVPFGDAAAIESAITENTVAVLIEPIQGEAGVRVPPPGYLAAVRRICDRHDVLMIAEDVQSGLGRTGETFACDHEGVVPDIYVLGKALGGGIVPVSAVVGDWPVLGVIRPGQHGSTFGGNPLACAVGSAVVEMLATGEYQRRRPRTRCAGCTGCSTTCRLPRVRRARHGPLGGRAVGAGDAQSADDL